MGIDTVIALVTLATLVSAVSWSVHKSAETEATVDRMNSQTRKVIRLLEKIVVLVEENQRTARAVEAAVEAMDKFHQDHAEIKCLHDRQLDALQQLLDRNE